LEQAVDVRLALPGRVTEGLGLLEDALTAMEAMGMVQWRSRLLTHLGEAYLLARRPEEATAHARRALALASERRHRGTEAWAHRLLGDLASCLDRPDVAMTEAHYGAAVALSSELGMHPLIAHCRFGLGKFYRRISKGDQAHEHLATPITLYGEMGMRYWLEQAQAASSELE
jgi:hypothetical protein